MEVRGIYEKKLTTLDRHPISSSEKQESCKEISQQNSVQQKDTK
jgi:hypothetical protein